MNSNRELLAIPGIGNPQWYSGACVFDDLIFTSGQIPLRADGTMPDHFEDQMLVVLENLETTLRAAGGTLGTLLKVNGYLASLDDFAAYNEAYTRTIAPHGLPPRTTVEIVRFPPPMRVEIEAIAHVSRR